MHESQLSTSQVLSLWEASPKGYQKGRREDKDERKIELPTWSTTGSGKEAVDCLDNQDDGPDPKNVPRPRFPSSKRYGGDPHGKDSKPKHEVSKLSVNRPNIVEYPWNPSSNLIQRQARRDFGRWRIRRHAQKLALGGKGSEETEYEEDSPSMLLVGFLCPRIFHDSLPPRSVSVCESEWFGSTEEAGTRPLPATVGVPNVIVSRGPALRGVADLERRSGMGIPIL